MQQICQSANYKKDKKEFLTLSVKPNCLSVYQCNNRRVRRARPFLKINLTSLTRLVSLEYVAVVLRLELPVILVIVSVIVLILRSRLVLNSEL